MWEKICVHNSRWFLQMNRSHCPNQRSPSPAARLTASFVLRGTVCGNPQRSGAWWMLVESLWCQECVQTDECRMLGFGMLPFGNLVTSWKLPFKVDLPIKNVGRFIASVLVVMQLSGSPSYIETMALIFNVIWLSTALAFRLRAEQIIGYRWAPVVC